MLRRHASPTPKQTSLLSTAFHQSVSRPVFVSCAIAALTVACSDSPPGPTVPETPVPPAPSTHPIIFSSYRDSTYGTGGRFNLEVLAATVDGSDIRNLSRDPASDVDPAWSPDGKFVAFASNRNGNFDIFVMRDDGSEVRQLTNDTLDERYPRWSPDGMKLVFESPRDGLLPAPGYARYTDLFVLDVDGSHIYNLTATPSKYERWAAWSPDGRTIAYRQTDDGVSQIFLVNADGSSPHPLRARDTDFVDDAPAWSPDGSRIAFSAFNLKHPAYTETYAILSVNVDGSDLRLLTGLGYESSRFPSWSPDGTRIVFNRDAVDEWWGRFSTQNVWIMNSDGSAKIQITQDRSSRNELGSPQAWRR
jgi:Tol biopolymer transport system component